MRHPREIAFRLRQEAANVYLLLRGTSSAGSSLDPVQDLLSPSFALESLQGSCYAREVQDLAAQILNHRIPIFNRFFELGPEIPWRRDYVHDIETGTKYFRMIPYLSFESAGDHKFIWELSRHQYLVTLAQAWRFTGNEAYLAELWRQLRSWIAANPVQRGINWTSALEVAFRALSWLWILQIAGKAMPRDLRDTFAAVLQRHGDHLEYNLSVYFSPNTHLLGEAVVLHALAVLLPDLPRAKRWEKLAGKIVEEEMFAQVKADGSHFEQSTYYHVYATDFFLLYRILTRGRTSPEYNARLHQMAVYLHALLGPARSLKFLGDDDGGRLFHPFGDRRLFGRATMATSSVLFEEPSWLGSAEDYDQQAAWWLGTARPKDPPVTGHYRSVYFPDAGMITLTSGDRHMLFDAGPFGVGTAGHSHSDTLSITASAGADELLIDPGTYTYISDVESRNWFRSSAAHNTVRVRERNQAEFARPFAWAGKPDVELRAWKTNDAQDRADAVCSYAGITHRRRIVFEKPDRLYILDELSEDSTEPALVEQFWHTPQPVTTIAPHIFSLGGKARLLTATDGTVEASQRSIVLGSKIPCNVIRVSVKERLPVRLWTILDFTGTLSMSSESVRKAVEDMSGIIE